MTFLLITATSHAREQYVEGKTPDGKAAAGYIEIDKGFYSGVVQDSTGNFFLIEGYCDDVGFIGDPIFFDIEPSDEKEDFFGQTPEFENERDFFEQKYELYLEEE